MNNIYVRWDLKFWSQILNLFQCAYIGWWTISTLADVELGESIPNIIFISQEFPNLDRLLLRFRDSQRRKSNWSSTAVNNGLCCILKASLIYSTSWRHPPRFSTLLNSSVNPALIKRLPLSLRARFLHSFEIESSLKKEYKAQIKHSGKLMAPQDPNFQSLPRLDWKIILSHSNWKNVMNSLRKSLTYIHNQSLIFQFISNVLGY